MSIASVVRRGYVDSIPSVSLRGYSTTASAPIRVGSIGPIRLVLNRPATAFDLARVFSASGVGYSITALHANGSFNTSTGVLTWNPLTVGTFGPYTVTAANSSGSVTSDAFTVTVQATAPAYGLYDFGLRFAIRIGL